MSNLTPKEIAKWFREQASEFNRMADSIERTFLSNGSPALSVGEVLTAQAIKGALKLKAMRKAELATRFGVSLDAIEQLITPENGLKKGAQGWIQEV